MSADLLAFHLKAEKIAFTREYRFHSTRRWRLDFLIPGADRSSSLAIEVDGGIYKQGRHTRGKGFESDCEKLNECAILGFKVLRFSTGQVKRGEAIALIKRARLTPEQGGVIVPPMSMPHRHMGTDA